jgi:hypothetical protein
MPIKAKSIGEAFEGHDIYELSYTRTGFRAVVTGFAENSKQSTYLEIFFPEVRAFRCLDEGDLIVYWKSGQFQTGHCIYRLTEGGWLENEVAGVLSVTSSVGGYTEYLVATEDYCACVLANEEPLLRSYADPFPVSAQGHNQQPKPTP